MKLSAISIFKDQHQTALEFFKLLIDFFSRQLGLPWLQSGFALEHVRDAAHLLGKGGDSCCKYLKHLVTLVQLASLTPQPQ